MSKQSDFGESYLLVDFFNSGNPASNHKKAILSWYFFNLFYLKGNLPQNPPLSALFSENSRTGVQRPPRALGRPTEHD